MNIEKLSELFFQGTTNLMMFLDPLGRIVDINPAGLTFSGFSKDEVIGKFFWKIPGVFSKRNLPNFLKVYKNSIKGIPTSSFVSDLTDKKGNKHVMDFSTYPIKEGKKVISILIIANDITKEYKAKQALIESEQKFKDLSECANDGIAIYTFEGKVAYSNKQTELITGYKASELENMKLHEIMGSSEAEKLQERFEKRIKGLSVPSLYETYIFRKDKSKIPIEVTVGKTIWENKPAVIAIVRDISERKEMQDELHKLNRSLEDRVKKRTKELEKINDLLKKEISDREKIEFALRESEEKFKNLAEKSPNMIYINIKGRIVFVNEVCEQIMGYTKEEFYSPSFNFLDLIAPESKDKVKESFKKHLEGEELPPYEYAIQTKSGNILSGIHTTKLIKFDGEVAILGIITDITKWKKIQEETKQIKENLQNIIDSASEIIFSIDLDYKINSWNSTAERLTGYKSKEIVGKKFSKINLIENNEVFYKYCENILEGKIPKMEEVILNTIDGGKILIQTSNSIIRSSSNTPIGCLFIGRDITKQMEIHGRLLTGNSYLILEETNDSSISIFSDLVIYNYNGLIITRDNPNTIKNLHKSIKFKTVLLSQDKIKGFDVISKPDELVAVVDNFIDKNANSVILINRLDYLITQFSFETILKMIYKINNIISKYNVILLIRLNPSLVNKTELASIKEEMLILPSQRLEDVEINEKFYNILKFIDKQKRNNMIVSYSSIGKEFKLSKVTIGNYLKILENKELIFIKKQGRLKTINLSKKGNMLLQKRRIT